MRDDQGRVHADLAGGQGGQGSHVLSALATADALAVIPEADDSLAGRRRGRAVVARPGLMRSRAAVTAAILGT